MSAETDLLSSLGLEGVLEDQFVRESDGTLSEPAGLRVAFATAEMTRALHHVIEGERPGAWRVAMKAIGHACGQKVAAALDAKLAALGKPALAALPLEACLVFLERTFAIHGWGRLKLDLTDAAEHGLVVARVEHSYFVEALPQVDDFVDPVLAGVLQGFFEYISGQTLGCEEIACARRGAPPCTFVITAPERLATVMPRLGRETADALIQSLRT